LRARFSAVLFDLDGTLLDTLDDIADAVNAVLLRFGRVPHPAEAYKRFVGDGMAELVERAFPPECLERETSARLIEAVRSEYALHLDKKTRPYPGVPEMLDSLRSRGLALAVLSNKQQEFTERSVRRLLPDWDFRAVRGASPDRPLKPDPGPALEVARGLGVPAARVLYLGDTSTDMRTAVAAGMFPVGALWGFRDARELLDAGAKELVREPSELLKLL